MNDSILDSIKNLLGIVSEYKVFDASLIMYINSVFPTLKQLGVGNHPFAITGSTETWSDFIGNKVSLIDVQTYIYLQVKNLFDPSTSSSILQAHGEKIKELEWRMIAEVETPGGEVHV